MSHIHDIVDADRHFIIDNVTKGITNKSDKLVISQYDHDSERYTFEIPRYIEDHDMTLCDRIEIHFTNITKNRKQQNNDVYVVKSADVDSDRDTVFFSWLVSRKATQLVGSLKFSVTFLCFDDEGNEIYNWGTDIFDAIQVIERLENKGSVVESNPDLFETMKQDILNSLPSSGSSIDKEEVERIVAEYIATNPPAPGEPGTDGVDGKDGTDGVSPTVTVEEIENGYRLTITDINGTNTVDILNGVDGTDGANGSNGIDGVSPTVTVEEIESGNRLTISDVNGENTIDILNGKDGIDGKDGADGYTPVKGVDYFTEAETAEIQQTVQTNLLASDELHDLIAGLFGQFVVIGDTEPENGPVLWFDTNVSASVDEAAILLVLGGEDDESEVIASIDESDYPVLNTDDPVPADDGDSYTITVS